MEKDRLPLGRIQDRQLLRLEQLLGVANVIFENICRKLDLLLCLGK